MPEEVITNKNKDPGFSDHLEVLRKHLIRIIIAVVICTIIAFVFKTLIFDTIILFPKSADFPFIKLLCNIGNAINTPSLCLQEMHFVLINTQVTGQFMLHLRISAASGFILSFPYILSEIWKFVKPALTFVEKKAVRGIIVYTSLLFFTGILFGYFVITPLAFFFFGNYTLSNDLQNLFTIHSYLSLLIRSVLTTGIAFELPLIIYFLSMAGLVTPEVLKKYRRHAVIILFIIAAILTPADPFSMILVALPLLLLYESGIFIAKRNQHRILNK